MQLQQLPYKILRILMGKLPYYDLNNLLLPNFGWELKQSCGSLDCGNLVAKS